MNLERRRRRRPSIVDSKSHLAPYDPTMLPSGESDSQRLLREAGYPLSTETSIVEPDQSPLAVKRLNGQLGSKRKRRSF